MVKILCQFCRNNETKTNFFMLSLYSYLDIPLSFGSNLTTGSMEKTAHPEAPSTATFG